MVEVLPPVPQAPGPPVLGAAKAAGAEDAPAKKKRFSAPRFVTADDIDHASAMTAFLLGRAIAGDQEEHGPRPEAPEGRANPGIVACSEDLTNGAWCSGGGPFELNNHPAAFPILAWCPAPPAPKIRPELLEDLFGPLDIEDAASRR